MRIKKYLSSIGFCSRRQAEEAIRSGRVLINGRKANLADKMSDGDKLVVDGKKIKKRLPAPGRVLLFNKPKGVLCTLKPDPGFRTLVDFDFGPGRVFPIGRMEVDAHGLLLLTSDGELGNRLASPSAERAEEYILVVKTKLTKDNLELFRAGAATKKYKTGPQNLTQQGEKTLRFSLQEGRFKHIKKLCEVAGVEIEELQRVRIGGIELGDLEPGRWKALDLEQFKKMLEKNHNGTGRPRRRIVVDTHRRRG